MPERSDTDIEFLGDEIDFLHVQFNKFLTDWDSPKVRKRLIAMGYPAPLDHIDLPKEAILKLAFYMEEKWASMSEENRDLLLKVGEALRLHDLRLNSPKLQPFLAQIGCRSRGEFSTTHFQELLSYLQTLPSTDHAPQKIPENKSKGIRGFTRI